MLLLFKSLTTFLEANALFLWAMFALSAGGLLLLHYRSWLTVVLAFAAVLTVIVPKFVDKQEKVSEAIESRPQLALVFQREAQVEGKDIYQLQVNNAPESPFIEQADVSVIIKGKVRKVQPQIVMGVDDVKGRIFVEGMSRNDATGELEVVRSAVKLTVRGISPGGSAYWNAFAETTAFAESHQLPFSVPGHLDESLTVTVRWLHQGEQLTYTFREPLSYGARLALLPQRE